MEKYYIVKSCTNRYSRWWFNLRRTRFIASINTNRNNSPLFTQVLDGLHQLDVVVLQRSSLGGHFECFCLVLSVEKVKLKTVSQKAK